MILKAINSFFQDREHEPLLRFEAYIAAPIRKTPLREKRVGLKAIRHVFTCSESSSVRGLWRIRRFAFHYDTLSIQACIEDQHESCDKETPLRPSKTPAMIKRRFVMIENHDCTGSHGYENSAPLNTHKRNDEACILDLGPM